MSILIRHWETDHDRQSVAMELAHGLVVDVGGRKNKPFPKATTTVGWEGDRQVDLGCEPLPFDDKEVDFLFCRHTLEDMSDPQHLLKEIRRVAKAGYLETPSPVVELTRGTDAYADHRGFGHHRWVCLGDGNQFSMCAKYPLVERMEIADLTRWLNQAGIEGWNTHCLFTEDAPLEWNVMQNEQGFRLSAIDMSGVSSDYRAVLYRMMSEFVAQINVPTDAVTD